MVVSRSLPHESVCTSPTRLKNLSGDTEVAVPPSPVFVFPHIILESDLSLSLWGPRSESNPYCICQFPINSWLISPNPCQQSIADSELIVDNVVLINKDPNLTFSPFWYYFVFAASASNICLDNDHCSSSSGPVSSPLTQSSDSGENEPLPDQGQQEVTSESSDKTDRIADMVDDLFRENDLTLKQPHSQTAKAFKRSTIWSGNQVFKACIVGRDIDISQWCSIC